MSKEEIEHLQRVIDDCWERAYFCADRGDDWLKSVYIEAADLLKGVRVHIEQSD